MVNDHYPYQMGIIGNIPYFQTNPNCHFQYQTVSKHRLKRWFLAWPMPKIAQMRWLWLRGWQRFESCLMCHGCHGCHGQSPQGSPFPARGLKMAYYGILWQTFTLLRTHHTSHLRALTTVLTPFFTLDLDSFYHSHSQSEQQTVPSQNASLAIHRLSVLVPRSPFTLLGSAWGAAIKTSCG